MVRSCKTCVCVCVFKFTCIIGTRYVFVCVRRVRASFMLFMSTLCKQTINQKLHHTKSHNITQHHTPLNNISQHHTTSCITSLTGLGLSVLRCFVPAHHFWDSMHGMTTETTMMNSRCTLFFSLVVVLKRRMQITNRSRSGNFCKFK